ncbi:MAG: hypothetical protein ACRC1V_05080 [Plesiomonas sp.]
MMKIVVPNVAHIALKVRKEIEKALGDTGKRVTVGVHESAGAKDGSDLTVATVAAINHFGNEHIPARPFLDVGVISKIDRINKVINDSGGENLDHALDVVGLVAVGAVQEYMTDLQAPANSAETIRRKGSANPLIDSGQLKQSITYQVTIEPVMEGL